jgi:YVTN family beta-propeller protein
MKVMWKAACAAVLLIAATTIEIGCGETYRPVATPLPVTTGNPSSAETEVVLSCCLNPTSANAISAVNSSVIDNINVSGDSNAGNKVLANVATSLAFDSGRTTVFSTNTTTDSVTQVSLNQSTAGFSSSTTTITLEQGSAPIGMSFEYFGATYAQDYVVNSGKTLTCPNGGSLGAIVQASAELKATICLDQTASGTNVQTHANPVSAWIYKDQTKVFVLDNTADQIYVVSAGTYKVTNIIKVGAAPIKTAQSSDGNYIYVLNSGDGSISIIDGQAESVVNTATPANNAACGAICTSPLIDIAQDPNFNDTTKNTQVNHVWMLHANGTVSVFDGTSPGQLTWITSLATTAAVSPTALPTNLALMRDGTMAYVGVKDTVITDKIIAIDTSKLGNGTITQNATTAITVGVHRDISQTLFDHTMNPPVAHPNMHVETTTPTVSFVAVSRGGNSADLSKAYVTTTTNTTYNCYDANVNPTDCGNTNPADGNPYLAAGCTNLGNTLMSCPNLYNGTAVVYAAANGTTPINTYVTTVPAPAVVTYCDPGNPATGEYDGQKNCPAMTPVLILGRS